MSRFGKLLLCTGKTILTMVTVVLAVSCVSAKHLDLVKNGEARYSIVLPPDALPSEQFAGEELAAYIKKMSGAMLPLTTVNTENEIVIGTPDSLKGIPGTVRERLGACKSDEAFYIKSEGGKVFIVGKKPLGALFGTYALLENYLGVRWFYPGDKGEFCPVLKTVKLPEIDDFQKPDMASRVPAIGGSYNFYDTVIWCTRHKMRSGAVPALRWLAVGRCSEEKAAFLNQALDAPASKGGHLVFEQAVPDALFKEHPEYFTLRNGKRECGGRLQRCVANPEVFKLVAEFGLKWCNANSNNIFTICSHDSRNSWCQCEECKKMGTVDGEFKITNLYHRFFHKVVEYILAQNPEARINVYFYIDYGVAPDDKSIQYRGKNVRGLYCTCFPHSRCYAHHFTDPACELNKKCLADLVEVLKICPRIYTYEYIGSSSMLYAPDYQTVAQDVKDLAAMGVEGYMDGAVGVNATVVAGNLKSDPESPFEWLARWPSFYLGAKLQWNAQLNAENLMEEAFDIYYGKAAPAMKQYHALRVKLWQNAPGHAFYGGPKRTAYCLTVPGAEKELRACLDDAKRRAAGDKVVLERVAMDETFLDKYWKTGAEELQKLFSAEKQIVPERAREKIVVDGNLTENTWVSARSVAGFLKMNTKQPSLQESNFRVAYDDANLYIGFVAMNDKAWSPAIANAGKRDDQDIFKDDHIELELAPADSNGRFYHICINTKGVFYDSQMIGANIESGYDSQAEIAVKKLADRFVYEMRLPLAPMQGSVAPGKVWGIYALRSCHNLQPPDVRETSALDGNAPHRVMEFRQAVFGDNVVKNGNFSHLEPKKKDNRGLIGDNGVVSWSVNAAEWEVLDRDPRPTCLRLKDGSMYSFLSIRPSDQGGKLVGELHASGSGKVSLQTSTCLRPPGSKEQGFSHSIKKNMGSFELTKEPAVFKFGCDFAPYEQGYLYVYVSGEVTISLISGVLVQDGREK